MDKTSLDYTENPEEREQNELIKELGYDEKLIGEFRRIKSKEVAREVRAQVEDLTNEILDEDLKEENEKAIEVMNAVYRKAWGMACEDLGYSQEEFPSKY